MRHRFSFFLEKQFTVALNNPVLPGMQTKWFFFFFFFEISAPTKNEKPRIYCCNVFLFLANKRCSLIIWHVFFTAFCARFRSVVAKVTSVSNQLMNISLNNVLFFVFYGMNEGPDIWMRVSFCSQTDEYMLITRKRKRFQECLGVVQLTSNSPSEILFVFISWKNFPGRWTWSPYTCHIHSL